MDLKVAAENLLKVADQIEKEAEQKTVFACESCNNRVTLALINGERAAFAEKEASESGTKIHVSKITVNDKVACDSCDGGCLSYEPSEESSKYWVEAAEEDDLETLDIAEEDDAEDKEKEDLDKADDSEDTDEDDKEDTGDDEEEELPDDLFEPVDEQEEKNKEEDTEEEPAEDTMEEEQPEDDAGSDDEESEEGEAEETDIEEVEEEPKPKPKKKKKDSPTDGKANLNKEPPPKFEKMPKEASDRFWSSVSRYSI